MERTLMAVAAGAASAAAAAVSVVSAAFALYAVALPHVGPAGASAVVAAAFAVLAWLIALVARNKAEGRRARAAEEADASLVERAFAMAKGHPLLAAGAAVAAGLYAIRNPALIAAVVGAIMENKSRKD